MAAFSYSFPGASALKHFIMAALIISKINTRVYYLQENVESTLVLELNDLALPANIRLEQKGNDKRTSLVH